MAALVEGVGLAGMDLVRMQKGSEYPKEDKRMGYLAAGWAEVDRVAAEKGQ